METFWSVWKRLTPHSVLWVRILPLRRGLRQITATCCFDRRRYACCRSSSALKPADPVCWAPESKGADPGPALINHPELQCPRGRTPDILWHKRLISTHSLAYEPWIYLLLRSHYDHTSCSKKTVFSLQVCLYLQGLEGSKVEMLPWGASECSEALLM